MLDWIPRNLLTQKIAASADRNAETLKVPTIESFVELFFN